MANLYSTRQAAKLIGVGFRTLNRWLADGRIKPSQTVPLGRGIFLWTDADIAKGRKVKGTQKPGPKPKKGAKK